MLLARISAFMLFCTQITCLTHWHIDASNYSLRLSGILKAYTVVVLVISIGVLFYELVFNGSYFGAMEQQKVLGEAIDDIQLLSVRVTHIITVLEALCKSKESTTVYIKLREIHEIFEHSLNVGIDYRNIGAIFAQPLIYMSVVYLSATFFTLIVKLIFPNPHILPYWFTYVLPFIVCAMRYYQVFVTIGFIKERFDTLITLLNDINLSQPNVGQQQSAVIPFYMTNEQQQLHRVQRNNEQAQLRKLLIIRDIYNRLWELSTLLNACFGISLLINVGNDFIFITSNCYWIFLNFEQYSTSVTDMLQLAAIAIVSLPHLLNVIMLAITCERTIQSTTGIAWGLHHIEVDLNNDNNNALIEQFSLQLLHQKMHFTAAGFFKIDCSLLYTIVGATTTYLIILIQFYVSDESRRH